MYNIIEAVAQLRGAAGTRQIPRARCACRRRCGGVVRDALLRRALVYGNGGIFSSSAVAILGRGNYSADV